MLSCVLESPLTRRQTPVEPKINLPFCAFYERWRQSFLVHWYQDQHCSVSLAVDLFQCCTPILEIFQYYRDLKHISILSPSRLTFLPSTSVTPTGNAQQFLPGLKTISTTPIPNIAAIASAPAIAGYCSFQKAGKHGSVNEMNAVGNKCTKAVAIKTPVPKCRTVKRKVGGMRRRGTRRMSSGKAQAVVEMKRMMKRAAMWTGRL